MGQQLCLLEVPLQQTLEGFAVPRFVAGHFIVGLRPTASYWSISFQRK